MVVCRFSHIKHGEKMGAEIYEGLTWCGKKASDWDFNDVNEAVSDAYKVGRRYLCRKCYNAVVEALDIGRVSAELDLPQFSDYAEKEFSDDENFLYNDKHFLYEKKT